MSKKLILVVEDDSTIRKFICTALTTQDYEVIESSTGKEAVQNAIAKSPDVMLLDLGLEDIDGIDVIKTVRQISDNWKRSSPKCYSKISRCYAT